MSFLYELKSFAFNLFVLDLSLASYYELAASDFNGILKYSSNEPMALVSLIISGLMIIFLFYDFWELFDASNKARITQQAQDFLRIGEMLKLREDLEKKYDLNEIKA